MHLLCTLKSGLCHDAFAFIRQPHMDIVAEHDIAQAVSDAVANEQVVDLHTHLFPPSHGALMLWGCDALLTYHYLIAEYFISALHPPSPEVFYRFVRARACVAC